MVRWRSGFFTLLAALGSVAACESGSVSFYTCEDPCETCADPCADCPGGECVPLPDFGWEGPGLLWMGNEVDAPLCPDHAPKLAFEGRAGLDASNQCPACSCGPPACVLPAGSTASTLSVCPNDGPGAVLTPLDAPPGWDGSCVVPPEVPPDPPASISAPALTVTPCIPVEAPVPRSLQTDWATFARACRGSPPAMCRDPGKYCAPTSAPPPPGFRQCVFRTGEQPQCPPDYPDRHVFHQDFTDTRECTPCACAPAIGSQCSAVVRYYADAACMTEMGATYPGDDGGACLTIMSGMTLGSMDATLLSDQPGACPALGGLPLGEAVPVEPSTFCCLPPDAL